MNCLPELVPTEKVYLSAPEKIGLCVSKNATAIQAIAAKHITNDLAFLKNRRILPSFLQASKLLTEFFDFILDPKIIIHPQSGWYFRTSAPKNWADTHAMIICYPWARTVTTSQLVGVAIREVKNTKKIGYCEHTEWLGRLDCFATLAMTGGRQRLVMTILPSASYPRDYRGDFVCKKKNRPRNARAGIVRFLISPRAQRGER